MKDIVYWMALAHLKRWTQATINNLVVDILHTKQMQFEEFFELSQDAFRTDFGLNDKQIASIEEAKQSLPNLSFLAEKLLSLGYEIIPLNSPQYSAILKENLKMKYAPTILYTKGNTNLLHEGCTAIVGSREAGERALEFTDVIAKKMSEDYKVIASGFARGVDKQALDSAVKYGGKSIIVLPQGILTFQSGMKKYYEQINEGKVLVLSTFPPEAGWSTGLAMARNRYIYGLATEIFVAQTSDKGGTWSGAMDGLKKGRSVYVLMPDEEENNANLKLINEGAIPVNMEGEILEFNREKPKQLKIFEA